MTTIMICSAHNNQKLTAATAEIARVGGCYAVQGHSRLLMLVPIESPYALPISE